jgi:cyclophilin family peptidyl-prolyl cis-trans isomerase/HEAT repeat protein
VTRTSLLALLVVAVLLPGCASAPPAPPAPPTWEQKLAWILRLEDQRVLRTAAPAPAPVPVGSRFGPSHLPVTPDLVLMLQDPEGRVRRRAALAIGRVGLAEGVEPLGRLLADPDQDVREMAVFALGILGSKAAVTPLAAALADSSPFVQGRAAEALGLLDAKDQAGPIAEMAAAHVAAGALRGLTADDQTYPQPPATEAVRLALYSLARLKSYPGIARVALDPSGRLLTHWWPVAYALRRADDERAAPALMALLAGEGQYSKAFAARGLGAIKHREAVAALLPLAADVARQPAVGIEAIRALGMVKAPDAAPVLLRIVRQSSNDASVRAEALTALAGAGSAADAESLLDLLSDRAPAVRAASLKALAALDPERFLFALSGLDPDPDPVVRAAQAAAAGALPTETATPLLLPVRDVDVRVLPAVFAALASAKVPGAEAPLVAALAHDDVVVRGAAADALGSLKVASAIAPLRAALARAQKDADYGARASILGALAAIDRPGAVPALTAALADPDWAVRRRAAALLAEIEPSRDTSAERPAPVELVRRVYEDPSVLSPRFSTHVYIDTDKGTVEIELAMLDAPLTTHNFATLARKGYFDGLTFHRVVGNFVVQDGDPRGDGEGGPGYTIRDELNMRPYLRGTVGMALAGPDTGGSQYFITHSPQPHLDARYTAFGQVVAGMEVVDRIAPGDVVRRVRVWDGQ